ncbi:MAG: ABC transporter substrate-binding protein, partial [Planctomycetes bacterium]|nr:ABC transporter substrate-binding protein [Planctomycetota bacterium]
FFQALNSNEIRIVDGNAMVKNLVARAHPDASPVLVGFTDTDDVLSGQADGEPIDMIFPDPDSLGTLVVPSTVGVIKRAPHPATAKRLVDYLVGSEVESQLVRGRAGYMPIRPHATGDEIVSDKQAIRAMKVSYASLLEQLEPSSRWTREHFHP